MIRFCDREVGLVEYDSLNRKELLEYFASGHEEDVLCVYDDFNAMGYIGKITAYSLQQSINMNGAIQEEYIILDKDMWYEARKNFAYRNIISKNNFLLPVFNKEGQLVCFAYEDEDANREMRQLRELSELSEVLQFPDIYPEYKCVKIHEFNELAYFFAKYLESQNVAVQVEGAMWREFFEGEECLVPDYECLNIYAEGTWDKNHNWRENLLRSVSVEFECIDKIYEANIKSGIIKDAKGSCADLLEYLKNEKEIILLGTCREAQDAYGFLLENGIDICCFASNEGSGVYFHTMFGKRVLSIQEARKLYKRPVFIDCVVQNSAWGMGETDYYDYIGYKRNENYILIKDYADISGRNLVNILKNKQIFLMGNVYLCKYVSTYLKQKKISVVGHLSIRDEEISLPDLPEIEEDDIEGELLCLIVAPVFWSGVFNQSIGTEREEIVRYLSERQINDYTDYFCELIPYINMESERKLKYTKKWLMPKRIVLGSVESFSGNTLIRGLLDGHPNMIFIQSYSCFNRYLCLLCVCLAGEKAENILSLFWYMMRNWPVMDPKAVDNVINNSVAFNKKMEELLAYDDTFTPQELFVMFHVAYEYMKGKNIERADINKMVIYWEPHYMERSILEEFTRWLGTDEAPCDIINIVRNACMRIGSYVRNSIQIWGVKHIYMDVVKCLNINKKSYECGKRLVIKFEDLKCNPRETLLEICDQWGIIWSDILMRTTSGGREQSYNNGEQVISNFDLAPVYNINEKYLSEFDRFRIMLLHSPWQKKYGYPYVGLQQFSRRELQELFLSGFRFDSFLDVEQNKIGLEFKLELQKAIRKQLQEVRIIDLLVGLTDMGEKEV